MIRKHFKEYKKKRIPIPTHKYRDVGVTEKSVLDLTVRMRNLKKGMKTTELKDIDGNFVVKLRSLNIENGF